MVEEFVPSNLNEPHGKARACVRCGYDRRGLPPGHRCPECGSLPPPPDVQVPCPECGHEWQGRALSGCLNCGHALPPGESFAWGTAMQRPSARGERMRLAGTLIALSAIPVGIVLGWINGCYACTAVTLLAIVGLSVRAAAERRRRTQFITPPRGTSQLRVGPGGFATRTGPGPVEWHPWRTRYRVRLRPDRAGTADALVVIEVPLMGPLVWDEPLKFRPLGGAKIARLLRDAMIECRAEDPRS